MNNSNAFAYSLVAMSLVIIFGGAFLYSEMLTKMSNMEKRFEGDVAKVSSNVSKKQDKPRGVEDGSKFEPESLSTSVTIGSPKNPLVNGITSVSIE